MKTPLRMGSMEMKRMKNFKYLGDIIDEQGLEESVDATGEGKVKGSILELKAVCKDFQVQICGGMIGALDIFNMAICPALLANCGSWINVGETTIKRLYSLQNTFVKVLLKLPSSIALPALRSETGLMGMKWRISLKNLRLVISIRNLEDNYLAKKVFKEQEAMDWPGLLTQTRSICKEIGIPDVTNKEVSPKEIKEAVFYHHYKELKTEVETYKKLKHLKHEDLRFVQSIWRKATLSSAEWPSD